MLMTLSNGLRVALVVSISVAAHAVEFLPEGKKVIAHYMTNMVPSAEGERVWAAPELHDPDGPTAALGGLYLTLPMWPVLRPNLSLAAAAEFEIRSALQLGVEGFQFYYPLFGSAEPLRRYNRIVREFVRVAQAKFPGFKLSLCLALGGEFPQLGEQGRLQVWGAALRELLDETGASPSWLRTRTGALLNYHWVTDGFADGVGGMATTPEHVERVAAAFGRLADRAGQPMQWVFHLRRTAPDDRYLDAVLRHFPAVWGWVESDDEPAFWDEVARRCAAAGVAYTQTVYPGYFTSKVYARGDRAYRLLPVEEAIARGTTGIERHYRQADLARGQVRLLQAALDRGAAIINYATWNDWPEGHHMAPEVNHGFGPAFLLRHFSALWRGQPSPWRDAAAVFFKRHPAHAAPANGIAVRVDSRRNSPEAEDALQLVSILDQPASCEVNGRRAGLMPAGFQLTEIPRPEGAGPVHVRLMREGKVIVDMVSPTNLEPAPRRVDRLTLSHTSTAGADFRAIFGEAPSAGESGHARAIRASYR